MEYPNVDNQFQSIPQMYTSGGQTLYDLDEIQKVSEAVCLVKTPKGSGTGFLIGPALIMTNAHVAENIATSKLSTAIFGLKEGNVEVELDPDGLYIDSPPPAQDQEVDNQHLDYAIVGLRDILKLHTILPLKLQAWEANDPVDAVIIQHPNGGSKKISLSGNKVTKIASLIIQYKTETAYGSSGSPVLCGFDGKLRLYALHHCRVPENNANEGIKIDAIIEDLEKRGEYGKIQIWSTSSGKNPFSPSSSSTATATTVPTQSIDWSANISPVSLCGNGAYHGPILELRDGNFACARQNNVDILERSSGDCVTTLSGHDKGVYHIIELGNGQIVTSSADFTVKIWTQSGQCRKTLRGHQDWIFCLIKLNDGWIASGGDEVIRIWDPITGQCKEKLETGGRLVALIELDNGNLVSGSNRNNKGIIKIWERNGICVSTNQPSGTGVGLLVKLKDQQFASGGGGGYITIWSHIGEKIIEWKAYEKNIGGMSGLLDGRISTENVEGIKVWNRKGECQLTFGKPPVNWQTALLWRSIELFDGNLALYQGGTGQIQIANTVTGKILNSFSVTTGAIGSVLCLRSGGFASAADIVKLWESNGKAE